MYSNVILTADKLKEAVDYFRTQPAFVFDVEAQGENRGVSHLSQLSWISLATKGTTIVVPFGHEKGDNIIGETKEPRIYESGKKIGQTYMKTVPLYDQAPGQLEAAAVFDILSPLFADPSIEKGGHDVVYDLASVPKYLGFVPPGPYFCTKVGRWLLDENKKQLGLKRMTEEEYGIVYDTEGIGACVEKYPFSLVAYYSYCDSKYAWLHRNRIKKQLEDQGLSSIFNMEMNLLNTMIGMKLAGAKVDIQRLHELRETLTRDLTEEELNIYTAAGKKFNPNSAKQKQEILYSPSSNGGQGLKPWKLTTGGLDKQEAGFPLTIHDYSTDADVLASYPENPVALALIQYNDTQKLLSTYVNGYLGVDNDPSHPCIIYDQHIHAGFMQYGTVTGRFSCRSPNLQNIPRPSSERGKLIRGIFIAEEGGRLVVADYGQIELVVLAHYVGEGKLHEAFMQGIDPHTMTAAMVLGKRPEDVTKNERQDLGKTLGFAVVYGAGIKKVASMAHISVPEAKRVLKKHAQMFPEIHGFKQAVIDTARSREPVPYITTLLGRKRRIPELNSREDGRRFSAERQMFNSLIQGGAADLIKLSMIRVDSMLPPEIQLTLTVHDEIVLASPANMAREAANILREAMTGEGIQKHVRVPLLADVKIVERWSDAK